MEFENMEIDSFKTSGSALTKAQRSEYPSFKVSGPEQWSPK